MTSASLGFRPASMSDIAGSIDLVVARRGFSTRPVRTAGSGVLRLMQPLYLDDSGQVTYIIVNPGGAYFGERYQVTVDIGPAANLLLSSQGATRIYRTPREPAIQNLNITLGVDSRLEYMPDQTIAYRDAEYRQLMRVEMTQNSTAFISDVVTPGWDPDDRRFTYSGMHLRTDIYEAHTSGLVCADNLRIQPGSIGHAIAGIGYMEGSSHLGSILILGRHTQTAYQETIREIAEQDPNIIAGVTRGTRHGVSWLMVRALSDSTDSLNEFTLTVNAFDRSVTTGQARLDLRRY